MQDLEQTFRYKNKLIKIHPERCPKISEDEGKTWSNILWVESSDDSEKVFISNSFIFSNTTEAMPRNGE